MVMEQHSEERRKTYRVETEIPVTVLPIDKTESSFPAVAGNISTGGVCFRVNEPLRDK